MSHSYRGRQASVQALGPLDLEVAPGEFLVLVGASGCGKSTLLRLVAGFERPTEGTLTVSVRCPCPGSAPVWCSSSRGCSRGARSAATSTWRSPMPASAGRTGTPRETACCGGWGSWAWPTGRCGRSPGVSSSGSRSRALAAHTPLLLLDEPLAALDALTRERLQEDIRTVSHETGRTSVFVTHSADEAVFLGSRIIVLTARPGRIALDLRVDLPRSGVDPDELRLTGVRGAAGAGGPRGQGRCVSRERAKAAFARIK